MTLKIHLIVLVHGLWGNNTDLAYMKNHLNKKLNNSIEEKVLNFFLENLKPSDELDKQYTYIYDSKYNNNFKTYDGIEMCGKRLQLELYQVLSKFSATEGKVIVNKVSIIGYSLGGLISRYCLGLLYNDGFFNYMENGKQKFEFVNFITFVSPHVGVISKDSKVAKLVGHTGVQLYLKDKDKLLYQMSLPNSSFIHGLKNFKNFKLYSNCVNDLKTNFFTTGISHADPFFEISEGTASSITWMKFISKYDGLIIDYDSSHLSINGSENKNQIYLSNKSNISFLSIDKKSLEFENEMSKELDVNIESNIKTENKKINHLIHVCEKAISLVFLLCFILFRTPYEILLSYSRRSKMIKLYKKEFMLINHIKVVINDNCVDEDEINSTLDTERTPMILTIAKSNEEIIAESFNEPPKTPFSVAKRTISSMIDTNHKPSLYLKELIDLGYEDLFQLKQDFFNLKLIDPGDFNIQHQIIKNMNQNIKWERYPVIIKKSKFSHAAIIVRYDKPNENFEEGMRVINHLADNIDI